MNKMAASHKPPNRQDIQTAQELLEMVLQNDDRLASGKIVEWGEGRSFRAEVYPKGRTVSFKRWHALFMPEGEEVDGERHHVLSAVRCSMATCLRRDPRVFLQRIVYPKLTVKWKVHGTDGIMRIDVDGYESDHFKVDFYLR